MSLIFKYNLGACPGLKRLEMPRGAKVLWLATQGGFACVWAQVDSRRGLVERFFLLVETGEDFRLATNARFAGTALLMDGYVLHVFEILEATEEKVYAGKT